MQGVANATPNLNDGNFFLGNSSNQSVSADFTTAVLGEISAGTGIGLSGGVISNTAPDQTVALTGGTGISTSGTYPNFTITNDSPDQTVALTGAGATSISGTYPNFTITSTDTVYTLPFADNSANWNTAYGWGNHATAGYFLASNWDTNVFKSGAEIAWVTGCINNVQWTDSNITSRFKRRRNKWALITLLPLRVILEVITGDQGNGLQTEQRCTRNTIMNDKYVRHYL